MRSIGCARNCRRWRIARCNFIDTESTTAAAQLGFVLCAAALSQTIRGRFSGNLLALERLKQNLRPSLDKKRIGPTMSQVLSGHVCTLVHRFHGD
jgi:hypothetical protein